MRKKIFAFLLLSALYAGAQEVPDWENPIVVGINKEPYHATLTLPSQKADCKEIISLNGKWRFQWPADPGKRPADFYKNDFNTDTWDTITVPGSMAIARLWQTYLFQRKLSFPEGCTQSNKRTSRRILQLRAQKSDRLLCHHVRGDARYERQVPIPSL